MTGKRPNVWALLGERTGDNNQVLALCEAIGLPFATRTLHYNPLRAIPARYLGATLVTLTSATKRAIRPPWPDLVVASGRRSVPVARWIRRASGNQTRLVLLGNPRVDPAIFDLVITTPQYPVPRGGNVLLLPLALTRFHNLAEPKPEPDELAILSALPRPHLLVAVGGPTKYWKLDNQCIRSALKQLSDRANQREGSLIVVGSRRTEPTVAAIIRQQLDEKHRLYIGGDRPRFRILLRDADEIFVTGDSVSMLSEAIQAGKPVGMIPISLTAKGRRKLRAEAQGPELRRRDLRRFWTRLEDDGLLGTIDEPQAGAFSDPSDVARRAVLALLAAS